MNRKTLVLPAVAGLLTPVLAECGGSDSGSKSGDAIVVGTTDQFTATKDAPAPLDPAYAYDVGTWNILRQSVQTLMAQPKGEGEPVPEAAESCSFTDSGSERYACKLREGLTFANGDPVTAEDVKYSIERALRINADSGVSALLNTIDTIETQGDREVVFHLKTADATFPYKLSTPVAGIVNPKDYQKDKLRDGFAIDGSGPYTFEAEVENNAIVSATFTKNPSYKGSVKVNNDKVELRAFADADAMGTAIDNGDIDVMTRTMSPAQIQKLDGGSDEKVDLVDMPGLEIRYLAFNTDASSVKSKAVRQAMAQIINRGELVSKVYGTQAEPLYSLVPATVTGHSNAFFNKYGNPSVDKAKGLPVQGRHHHPGEADPALHHRPLRLGHQAGVPGPAEAAQRQRPVRRLHRGPPLGDLPAGRAQGASTTSTAWAGSRTSPTPTTSSRPSWTRTTSSARRTPTAPSSVR